MVNATIRPMQVEDLPAVYRLGLECDHVLDKPYNYWTVREVAEHLETEPGLCFVADGEDQIVGFVLGAESYEVLEDTGHLEWVAVAPSARGRGIATDLIAVIVEELRRRGRPRSSPTSPVQTPRRQRSSAAPASRRASPSRSLRAAWTDARMGCRGQSTSGDGDAGPTRHPPSSGSTSAMSAARSGRAPMRWDAGRRWASCWGEPVVRRSSRARAGVRGSAPAARRMPCRQASAPTTMGLALEVPLKRSEYQASSSSPPWRSP